MLKDGNGRIETDGKKRDEKPKFVEKTNGFARGSRPYCTNRGCKRNVCEEVGDLCTLGGLGLFLKITWTKRKFSTPQTVLKFCVPASMDLWLQTQILDTSP